MATYYVDQGAYGNYAAVPTWGQAQDGDGTSKSLATPATAEIVFTGVPSSGTIAVLGVPLTVSWATSADNCANLLATAINASTATATSPAGITRKSQVRNHLYARGPANGAPSGTCEIMMRQGTAAVNGQNAITHTLNNVSTTSPITFAGGAGGAWGYVWNHSATIWPSVVAIMGYGVFAGTLPFCGALDPGDIVHVRSNKTLTLSDANAQYTASLAAMGSAAAPIFFVIDNGTIWPADGSTPVFKLVRTSAAGSNNLLWTWPNNVFAHILGRQYSSGQRNFVLEVSQQTGTALSLNIRTEGQVRAEHLDIVCLSGASSSFTFSGATSETLGASVLYRCRQLQATQPNPFVDYPLGGNPRSLKFIEHTFELTAQAAISSAINFFGTGGVHGVIELEGCKFIGFVSGSRLQASRGSGVPGALIAKNCEFGNITNFGPTAPQLVGNGSQVPNGTRGTTITSQYGFREWALEIPAKLYAEHNRAKGYPTLSALLPDGVTPFAIYVVPTSAAGNISVHNPAELPRINKILPAASLLPQAARTVKLEFLLESTLTWTRANLAIQLTYVTASGAVKIMDSYDRDGAALTTSTAAWTATSWNGQTWLKRSISLTTPEAVLAGSELSLAIKLYSSVANETLGIIVDPEFVVT